MNMLKPTDINVMYAALELRVEPFNLENLGITLSENLENPFAAEQEHAQNLIERLDNFLAAPEDGLSLPSEDANFLIDALRHLIEINQECIRSEKKAKLLKRLDHEARAASVCISRLQEFLASDGA